MNSTVILEKLHDLCHEYFAHRDEIQSDERVRFFLDKFLEFTRIFSQENIDYFLKHIHDSLHEFRLHESYHIEEIPAKLEHISFSLNKMRSDFAEMYSIMQATKAGIDQSFKIYHSRTYCTGTDDNAIEGYREKDRMIFKCTVCNKEWEIRGWDMV